MTSEHNTTLLLDIEHAFNIIIRGNYNKALSGLVYLCVMHLYELCSKTYMDISYIYMYVCFCNLLYIYIVG